MTVQRRWSPDDRNPESLSRGETTPAVEPSLSELPPTLFSLPSLLPSDCTETGHPLSERPEVDAGPRRTTVESTRRDDYPARDSYQRPEFETSPTAADRGISDADRGVVEQIEAPQSDRFDGGPPGGSSGPPPAIPASLNTPASNFGRAARSEPPQDRADLSDDHDWQSLAGPSREVSGLPNDVPAPIDHPPREEDQLQDRPFSDTVSRRPEYFSPDQPAGRSWMETVRSHGVVVVLLLLVVAAALLTGGRPDDSAEVLPLEDEISFDVGSSVAVPVENDSIEYSEVSTPTEDVDFANLFNDEPTSSSASLSSPQADSSTLAPLPTSDELMNQTSARFAPQPSVQATPASERISTTPDFGQPSPIPSLDELADTLPEYDAGPNQVEGNPYSAKPQYARTKTPNGIDDWLKYLPNKQ